MHDFCYVSKKEAAPVKAELLDIIHEVQDIVRDDFTFQFTFIGSSSRNMITYDRKPVRCSALTVSDGYLRIRLLGTTLTVGIVRTTKSGQRRRIPFPMRTPMSTSNCGVIPRSSTGLQASFAIICWNRTIRKKEV